MKRRSCFLALSLLASSFLALACNDGGAAATGGTTPSADPATTASAAPTTEPTADATAEPTAEPSAEPTAEPSATAAPSATTATTGTKPPPAATPTASASASAGGSDASKWSCGNKGQKACPMQGWMKGVMARAMASGDNAKIAQALNTIAAKPVPGYGSWVGIAAEGAAKAQAGDVEGAKASCKKCHALYQKKYVSTMRDAPW